jgi:hypothetical protein
LSLLAVIIAVTTSPLTAARQAASSGSGNVPLSAASAAPGCHAKATNKRPRDHSRVGIRVRTTAYARVTATVSQGAAGTEHAAGRASATGLRMLRFRVGNAVPGRRVVIVVRIARGAIRGTCHASFRPRPAQATVAPPPA